jgi:hypothetical protein
VLDKACFIWHTGTHNEWPYSLWPLYSGAHDLCGNLFYFFPQLKKCNEIYLFYFNIRDSDVVDELNDFSRNSFQVYNFESSHKT